MALLEKQLIVKKSTLAGAGRGLFTRVAIPKGRRIVEYKGEILTWSEVEKMPDERNGYVFYFTRKYVIDAWKTKKSVAHFANDARGIVRVDGVRNNAEYVTSGKHCYIKSIRPIPAGGEIFVSYGKEYWDAIRYNIRVDQRKKKGKKAAKTLPHHHVAKRQTRHREG